MFQASASAKVILFGEHAVVHGQPAIAVPVSSLRAYATAEQASEKGVRIHAANLDRVIPVNLDSQMLEDGLALVIRLILERAGRLNPRPDLDIAIESDIPLASGLGSGAAVSTAIARALSGALSLSLSDDELNEIVFEVEKTFHGTPSGIDNTVIVYETPVYFVRSAGIERLSIRQPFKLIIADTGVSAPTRAAVEDVARQLEQEPDRVQPILVEIGDIARTARNYLEVGEIGPPLGELMTRNHGLLQQIDVSSSLLDTLVAAALRAGALGAKLSGGGRGGNMIALVGEARIEAVVQSLRLAGAVRVFVTTVG